MKMNINSVDHQVKRVKSIFLSVNVSYSIFSFHLRLFAHTNTYAYICAYIDAHYKSGHHYYEGLNAYHEAQKSSFTSLFDD